MLPNTISDDTHSIKKIKFNKKQTPLITQNTFGPCSLISLANTLVLRGLITIPHDKITTTYLLDMIVNLILDKTDTIPLKYSLDTILDTLPKLVSGLDINIHFDGPCSFDESVGNYLFHILDVKLLHAYVIEPTDQYFKFIDFSYNGLNDYLIRLSEDDPHSIGFGGCDSDFTLGTEFMRETATRMTKYGLWCVRNILKENDLAVLFHNDHYSTIYRKNGIIYSLVTDQGYLQKDDIVWESLTSSRGSTDYVNSEFLPPGLSLEKNEQVESDGFAEKESSLCTIQ